MTWTWRNKNNNVYLMKRLLVYLFIVLGLGLAFNANAEIDEDIKELEKSVHEQKVSETELFNLYKKYSFSIGDLTNSKNNYSKMDTSEGRALLYQSILLSNDEKNILEFAYLLKKSFIDDDLQNAFVFELSKILINIKDPPSNYLAFYKNNINPKITQIAKKEPSQTQQLSIKQIADKAVKILKTRTKKSKIKELKIKELKIKELEINPKDQKLINKFAVYEKQCVPIKKKGFSKEKICLKVKDILKLGYFKKPNSYPDGMIGKCKIDNWNCISKKAGQNVYKNFVQRSEQGHARKPGAIIQGMSWYELMYLDTLKKNTKKINRYLTSEPESYFKFNSDARKINSLIKMNNGRIKMREALGFTIGDDVEDVIKGQWLLASFLNKDKLKVKKVKIHPDIKKRKILLAKYKSAIASYKKKLKEKNN